MENNESTPIKQRSPEWFESRFGCFTASEFYKLMVSGKRKMTPEELAIEQFNKGKRTTIETTFGETAKTYIFTKIAEILTNGLSQQFGFTGSKETEWGEILESTARDYFTEVTGEKVTECDFLKISDRFGGSPDGLTDDAIIEIKCPYNCTNHIQNLMIKDVDEFIDVHYEYYIQMQVNMIAAKKEKGYFISFDNRLCNKAFWIKIIEVPIDLNVKRDILFRYSEAMKVINSNLEYFYNQLFED